MITPSIAKPSPFKPKALILPVKKDSSTLQYIAKIKHRTPSVSIKLALDLDAEYLWVACDDYVSSTYKPARCGSSQCSLANAECGFCPAPTPYPGCNVNTCNIQISNPFTDQITPAELSQDVVSIKSTDGSNPGRSVSVHNFLFSCSFDHFLGNMAMGVKGMVGLGRNKIGLPSQFASAFGFNDKFAICLSPSTTSNGFIFFGDGPYNFLPNKIDISRSLTYTPLIKNPTRNDGYLVGKLYAEYFIGVKSIKINDKVVPLNTSLLTINKWGMWGTRISTVHPYTLLETSIYKAFVNEFVKAMGKVPRVAPIKPFEACFNSSHIDRTRYGPAVPLIDLVLKKSNDAYWRIFGSNSMVEVAKDVLCLGFVDAGEYEPSSIVIGGHQLEDNLVQFDIASNRVGFSSSLLSKQTSCSNFNFTSI